MLLLLVMAAKRARTDGGSVTGGTGDVKPQILTLGTGTTDAPGKYAVNQVALPVPRFGTTQTKATIIEMLSVDWYINILNQGDTSSTDWAYLSTNTNRVSGDSSTAASQLVDVADPLTFGMVVNIKGLVTSGVLQREMPQHMDFTDQNGNGMLVATDRIFVAAGNVAGAVGIEAICKLKYRLVNVGITEYVGIVQSQQA